MTATDWFAAYDARQVARKTGPKAKAVDVKGVGRALAEARDGAVVTRSWGCARIYVSFCSKGLRETEALTVELRAAGLRVTRRPNAPGLHLYVGYDNATGSQYAQGAAMVAAFNALGLERFGFHASVDGDED